MKPIYKKTILIIFFFLILLSIYLFVGSPPVSEEIAWGVNFSQKHTENLGLDWKETYLALLDDLRVRNLKIASHWDLIESNEREYNFEDLDWQIKEAENREAKVLLVIGMKTPRWPECHIPEWAKNLKKKEQQERILKLVEKTVLRYRDSEDIWAWQVENEPFFPFGECPWADKDFVKEEVNLVKSLDSNRPIIISDSGEGSSWITAAQIGDIVGTTMYKKVWFRQLSIYIYYPLPPVFYWRKARLIKRLFNKKVIVVELQAEPWGPKLMYDLPLEEQKKTMNLNQFRYNIEFAKKTGFDTFYLWGAEWWYWMKETQNKPNIWNEAKKLWSIES